MYCDACRYFGSTEMIKFTLVVESVAEDGSRGERNLEKEIDWPELPRIGEQVVLEGNATRVFDVDHDFSNGKISVLAGVDDDEFDRLAILDGYVRTF